MPEKSVSSSQLSVISKKNLKTENRQPTTSSIDPAEIAKFSAMADEWWDESGKFAPLHKFNPARISYILDHAKSHFKLKDSAQPLKGLRILDIGCGGGLLCEPMARLGAEITGIDASEKNIKIAKLHAEREELDINYICTTAEELLSSLGEDRTSEPAMSPQSGVSSESLEKLSGKHPIKSSRVQNVRASHELAEGSSHGEDRSPSRGYHIVLNMEVIEHVADVASFMHSCCALVKPGGLMFVATMNRTPKSFLFAIVGAEYVLRWLPKGTHDWSRFLKPSEIDAELRAGSMRIKELKGMSYNILKNDWQVSSDLGVNYIICTEKV